MSDSYTAQHTVEGIVSKEHYMKVFSGKLKASAGTVKVGHKYVVQMDNDPNHIMPN